MKKGIVLRIGELFLKRGNRPMFERSLEERVRRITSRHGAFEIHRGQGRLFLIGDAQEGLLEELSEVFGLASVSPVFFVDQDLEALTERALALAQEAEQSGAVTFKIASRRADKRFALTSLQLNIELGARVGEATGLSVDLEAPDLTIGVEVGPKLTFVHSRTIAGAGGLPVGVAGEAILLLSGGIDSPVAGHLMQKRGLRVAGVHFHSAPWTSAASQEKVRKLAGMLAERQGAMDLYMIPFGATQEKIREAVDESYRIIIYRRFMLRIAERFGEAREAKALITGDSLGQVASQTVENLACIEAATNSLVLRPLLGYDKQEVIALARRIGTYDVSIEPHDDCCSLFIPRHPQTRGSAARVRRLERRLEVDALVEAAVKESQIEAITTTSSP